MEVLTLNNNMRADLYFLLALGALHNKNKYRSEYADNSLLFQELDRVIAEAVDEQRIVSNLFQGVLKSHDQQMIQMVFLDVAQRVKSMDLQQQELFKLMQNQLIDWAQRTENIQDLMQMKQTSFERLGEELWAFGQQIITLEINESQKDRLRSELDAILSQVIVAREQRKASVESPSELKRLENKKVIENVAPPKIFTEIVVETQFLIQVLPDMMNIRLVDEQDVNERLDLKLIVSQKSDNIVWIKNSFYQWILNEGAQLLLEVIVAYERERSLEHILLNLSDDQAEELFGRLSLAWS